MKLKITWLETILSRWGPDAPSSPEGIESKELDLPNNKQRQMNDASMPDIYVGGDAETVPDLRIIGPSLPDANKETGFNPYDTARMHKK